MKPCNSSVLAVNLGSNSNWIANSLWKIRDEAVESDSALKDKYYYQCNNPEEDDSDITLQPKTVLVDNTGEFTQSFEEDLDEQNMLWGGHSQVIKQENKSSPSSHNL